MRMVPDELELFSADGAARHLNMKPDTLLHLRRAGIFVPARYGSEYIYTRADLDRYATRAPELAIVEALERGEAPIPALLAANGKVRLKDLGRIVQEWARVSSFWLVQGPPGSYARWLQRLGVLRVHTTDLRRVIEVLIADDATAHKARLAFDAARAARLQAERARALETTSDLTTDSASGAP